MVYALLRYKSKSLAKIDQMKYKSHPEKGLLEKMVKQFADSLMTKPENKKRNP